MKYILLIGFFAGGMAQNYKWDYEEDRGRRSPEKIENMLVWRLTDDLDLSTEQAEKFFPRFRDHRKNLKEIGNQERNIITSVDRNNLNKNDVKKTIEEIAKLRQNRIELESDFVLGMDDILEPGQMLRLGVFKQRIMSEMKGDIQDRKGNKKRHKKKGRKRRHNWF